MKHILPALVFLYTLLAAACMDIDASEKYNKIPNFVWHEKKPVQIAFELRDTTHTYKIYFVVKHMNNYAYKNLWVALRITPPQMDTQDIARTYPVNLTLADDEKGWHGIGLGNTYEQRILWQGFKPKKQGLYTFDMQQIMRDSSLWGIASIGLRIEK